MLLIYAAIAVMVLLIISNTVVLVVLRRHIRVCERLLSQVVVVHGAHNMGGR
jgi:hypothetical protein